MRYFQPKGGFPEKHVIGIDENGMSHVVSADGKSQPTQTVDDLTKRATPVWTQQELENFVKDGTWEEVQGPGDAQQGQQPPQQQGQHAPQPVRTQQPSAGPNAPDSQPQQGNAPPPVRPTPPLPKTPPQQ
jgi:hypothetical protein